MILKYLLNTQLISKIQYNIGTTCKILIVFDDMIADRINNTLIFFYKHNNYKDTYGKKCEKISIILSTMLR